MNGRRVIWPGPIRAKLVSFRSPHFTPEETSDFIAQFILETEDFLLNPLISRLYTEERGEFKGVSRCVIRGFRVYSELVDNDVVILAVKFPREN